MTPFEFAQACADTYDAPGAAPGAAWVHEWRVADVHVCHRVVDGVNVFAFEGSKTATDWLRDGEGWPAWHPALGFVHHGFLEGLDEVFAAIQPCAGERNAFTGHSLGGARARVHAAYFAVKGIPVDEVHVFGSPKPAFANLSRIIQKSGMRHFSWRNRNDPVPLVPGILPYWEHPEAYGVFDQAPDPQDLEPLRDHHMALYLAGARLVSP